jgi:cytochrome b6-f complex iron-sulfur subunit
MTIALTLLATTAALLALAFWWIRRTNLAVYPAGRAPLALRPLPTGCDLGERLMMASSTATPTAAPPGGGGGGAGAAGGLPPKRKTPSGPSRRTFLRNTWLIATLGLLSSFGGATLAFLWPSLRGGFGAVIDVDSVEGALEEISSNAGRYEFPAGRMYLVPYDASLDPEGVYAEITNGAPVMALYQRCVHLGCKVPWCESSQWFECPCHGSRYNRWGEYQGGPAPRGLDRFSVSVEEGRLLVDTSTIITGPSRQADVLNQPPEGPSCL